MVQVNATIQSKAEFDNKGVYRFSLERIWNSSKDNLLFIGLNPSDSDELITDQTVNHMLGVAKSLGFGGLFVVNLFSLISPSPSVMKEHKLPIGDKTDESIIYFSNQASKIVIGWGSDGVYKNRDKEVMKLLSGLKLYCLGLNSDNTPQHPKYQQINKIKPNLTEFNVL